MKHIKKRWLSVVIAPALLALLSVAQPAYADDYSYSCADVPASIDGNVFISDENACTISHDVTATGNITVSSLNGSVTAQGLTASGGSVLVTAPTSISITGAISSHLNTILSASTVTVDDITSDWGVQITATDGSITVADVVSNNNNSSDGGNILMHASGDIGTGNLKNNGTSTTGGIEIHANEGGTSGVFNIGGSGSNGTGTLDVRTATGGGTANNSIRGGIWISNGSIGSTGGITVSSMSDILLTASASRSAILLLDAKAGTLTLPAGTLSSDGTASSGAGFIALLANSIDTATGTVVTASQDSSVAGTYHGVLIAASTINTSGSSGLEFHADGNGVTGVSSSAALRFVPEGSVALSSTDELNALYWNTSISNFLTTIGTVEITGDGSFKATANGNNQLLAISGYPLKFTADNVELEAKGATDHNIKLGFYGSLAGGEGLAFTGSGDFKADASGIDGNGGKIEINGADSEISSASFVVKANGPSAGNGDGGTVKWYSTALTVDESTKVSFAANAALVGTGDAKTNAIDFHNVSGDLNIGTDEGQTSFSAKGGGTSGNGGTIKFGSGGAVTVYGAGPTAGVFDVSVPGDTGNGGKIDIFAVLGITFDGTASYLKADSGSVSGDGGTIQIQTSAQPFIIGSDEAGAVDLSAKSNGDGKGGTVDIYSPVGLRANGANINVSAGEAKKGGKITLDAGSVEDLLISGILKADGGADGGDGGSIILNGGKVTLPGGANTEVKANGKGDGDGGTIDITTNYEGTIRIGNGTAEIRLEANSEDGGKGGAINLLADGEVYLYGAAIDVNALGGDGDGGTITAESRADAVIVVGDLTASGFGDGDGGTINLKSVLNIDLTDAYIRAPGGLTGSGGEISITTEGELTLDNLSEISALAGGSGDGVGGDVTVSAINSTIAGTIKAEGYGTGNGGSVEVTSEGYLDLSESTVSANGGEAGDGGTITLTYSSSDELPVNNVSATSGTSTTGTISIINHSTSDMIVAISGSLDTSSSTSSEASGSLILNVDDSETDSISLSIEENGSFKSILTATAASINVSSLAAIDLGLEDVVSTTGDINICLDSEDLCSLALARREGHKSLEDSASTITNFGNVSSAQDLVKSARKIVLKHLTQAERNISFKTSTLTLDAQLSANHGTVTITALGSGSDTDDLIIKGSAASIVANAPEEVNAISFLVPPSGTDGNLVIQDPLVLNSGASGVALTAGVSSTSGTVPDNSTSRIQFDEDVSIFSTTVLLGAPQIVNNTDVTVTLDEGSIAQVTTYYLTNRGVMNGKKWQLLNGSMEIDGGGTISAYTGGDVLFAFDNESLPSASLHIIDQAISAPKIFVFTHQITADEESTLSAESELLIYTESGTNNGKFMATDVNGEVKLYSLAGTLVLTTILQGTGEIDSTSFVIGTSNNANIEQDTISGVIDASSDRAISITASSQDLIIKHVESVSGKIEIVAAAGNIAVLPSTTITAPSGNVVLQASGSTASLSVGNSSVISAEGGGSVKLHTGPAPTGGYVTGVVPAGVTLINAASLGVNVFFGSGAGVGTSIDFDVGSGGAGIFLNGGNISIGSNTLIQSN